MAVKYDVNVIGGSQFVVEHDTLYNIAYLFRRDGSIGKQYKIHITPSERKWWGVSPGNGVEVFETDCGPIAIQICYDIEFPELTRIAAQKREPQIVFVLQHGHASRLLASSPLRTGPLRRKPLVRGDFRLHRATCRSSKTRTSITPNQGSSRRRTSNLRGTQWLPSAIQMWKP